MRHGVYGVYMKGEYFRKRLNKVYCFNYINSIFLNYVKMKVGLSLWDGGNTFNP